MVRSVGHRRASHSRDAIRASNEFCRAVNRQHAGHRTSGHVTSGHRTSGHRTSGHRTSGHVTSGHRASDHDPTGWGRIWLLRNSSEH
jgi:hypothetical protein